MPTNPSVADCDVVLGTVTQIGVDRVGSDDNLNITIRPSDGSESVSLTAQMHEGAIAILAQLQVFRHAMEHKLTARVYYLDGKFYAVRMW